jgi:hypothetical protein
MTRQPSDQPVNPVEVEQAIRSIANDIARGVKIRSDALREFRDREREFDLAFARAYMRFAGPAHAKRYAADIATQDERAARDAAEVAWKYADNQGRALELELSAYQSINRSVTGMYGAAGA